MALCAMFGHAFHGTILNKDALFVAIAAVVLAGRTILIGPELFCVLHRYTAALAKKIQVFTIFYKYIVDPVGGRFGRKLEHTILWIIYSARNMGKHPVIPERFFYALIGYNLHFTRVNHTIFTFYDGDSSL